MPLDGSSPLLVLAFLLNSALGPLRSKFTHSCTSSISNSFGAAETLTPCRFADITDSEYRAMLGYRRMGWTPSSSAIMRRLVCGVSPDITKYCTDALFLPQAVGARRVILLSEVSSKVGVPRSRFSKAGNLNMLVSGLELLVFLQLPCNVALPTPCCSEAALSRPESFFHLLPLGRTHLYSSVNTVLKPSHPRNVLLCLYGDCNLFS